MSAKKYNNVPVKKEMADKLSRLDPNKSLKILVAEAINEYIGSRTLCITNKTFGVMPQNIYVSPGFAPSSQSYLNP